MKNNVQTFILPQANRFSTLLNRYSSMSNDHFLQTLVYHIPHSSIYIPDTTGFITERIEDNLLEMTDWATDEMFCTEGAARLVVPHSRLFCDVERFDDEHEPQFKNGRGFYYSNGYDGLPLRAVDEEHKRVVYNDYYKKHHGALYQAVMEKIEQYGVCHVIDCHSFGDNPYGTPADVPSNPDICIGTDPFHTPDYLLEQTIHFWESRGYSVDVNNPFAGCIVPIEHLEREPRVKGMMIEVHKRLYMNGPVVVSERVGMIRNLVDEMVGTISVP